MKLHNDTIKVGVFLLRDMILYPHSNLPLTIQDTTYQKMIADALEQNFSIAMGLGDAVFLPNGQVAEHLGHPKEIMGLGVPEILQTEPNGSQHVLFRGVGKVQILRILSTTPYLLCEAKLLSDTDSYAYSGGDNSHLNPIHRLERVLINWLRTNIDDPAYLKYTLRNIVTISQIVDYLATFLIQDREIKQILLETHSLNERIQLLNILFPIESAKRENIFSGEMLKQFEYDDRPLGALS